MIRAFCTGSRVHKARTRLDFPWNCDSRVTPCLPYVRERR